MQRDAAVAPCPHCANKVKTRVHIAYFSGGKALAGCWRELGQGVFAVREKNAYISKVANTTLCYRRVNYPEQQSYNCLGDKNINTHQKHLLSADQLPQMGFFSLF